MGSLHDDASRSVDAALLSNRFGGQRVVSGTHFHANACLATIGNGFPDTWTERILDADDGNEREISRQVIVIDLSTTSGVKHGSSNEFTHLVVIPKARSLRRPGGKVAVTQRDRA